MNDDSLLNLAIITATILFIATALVSLRRYHAEQKKRQEAKEHNRFVENRTRLLDAEFRAIAVHERAEEEKQHQQHTAQQRIQQQLFQEADSITKRNSSATKARCFIEKFVVQNGIGPDRSAAVIDVRWKGPDGSHLVLFKNRGEICRDIRELTNENANSKRIDFSTKKPNFRHVDVQVKEGKVYNYYAYVEAYFEVASVTKGNNPQIRNQSIAGSFRYQAKSLSVRASETKGEFFQRDIDEMAGEIDRATMKQKHTKTMEKLTGKKSSDPLAAARQILDQTIMDGKVINREEQLREMIINEYGVTDEDEINHLLNIIIVEERRQD